MAQMDIREAPNLPPGCDVLPEGPPWVAIPLQPVMIILPDGSRWSLDRRADPPWRVVQDRIPLVIDVDLMVVHTPDDIASIPPNVEILSLWGKDEGLHGQMRLEAPPMRLRFNSGERLRLRDPDIQPGRHGRHIQAFGPLKQELGDDLLNPGRPRLGIGSNDDIIRAKVKGIPDRGIK